MRQISLVGAVDEEVGNYFPEFLGMLEESPFLKVSSDRMNGSSAYTATERMERAGIRKCQSYKADLPKYFIAFTPLTVWKCT